jgi:hypothetical protein
MCQVEALANTLPAPRSPICRFNRAAVSGPHPWTDPAAASNDRKRVCNSITPTSAVVVAGWRRSEQGGELALSTLSSP